MNEVKKILETIRKIRQEKGLSQEQVAEKLAISRQMYTNYENGKSEITLNRFLKLIQVLEIDKIHIFKVEHTISKEALEKLFKTIENLKDKLL